MTRHPARHGASLLTLAGLLAVSLAACNKPAPAPVDAVTGLPLVAGPATAEAAAPPAAALPAPASPIAAHWRADPGRYAYLDDAYGMSDAFGDAPPDYAFDYDGVEPWAWRGGDGSRRFAEPVSGGYRYYYYRSGASRPYLVRDPDYAYGYDGDQLVVVYDSRGRPLPQADFDRRSDAAGRYLNRARALAAAADASRRRSVVAANWAARQNQIAAQRSEWAAQQAQDSDWRAYHQSHAQQEDNRWADERRQRQAAAAGFNNWRQTNFQGAPPPPAWTPPRGGAPGGPAGPGPRPGDGEPRRPDGRVDDGRQGPPPQPQPQPVGPVHSAQQDAAAAQQAEAQARQAALESQRQALKATQAAQQAAAQQAAAQQALARQGQGRHAADAPSPGHARGEGPRAPVAPPAAGAPVPVPVGQPPVPPGGGREHKPHPKAPDDTGDKRDKGDKDGHP